MLVPALAWVLVPVPVLAQELVLERVLVPVQALVAGQLLGLSELLEQKQDWLGEQKGQFHDLGVGQG